MSEDPEKQKDHCPACGRDLGGARLEIEDGGTFATPNGQLKVYPRWTGYCVCKCSYRFKGWR